MDRRHLLLASASALLAPLAGCGLGAGPAPRAVTLLVTRDFGARVLQLAEAPQPRAGETVMSLLRGHGPVATRADGAVQVIRGLAGGQEGGRPVAWFYYVNGVQVPSRAAATSVHPGDHIWWDRHDWSQTEEIPAVVGSFPEPFLNGIAGRRLPVRVECAVVGSPACATVAARLRAAGAPAAIAGLVGGGAQTLCVRVGAWASLRRGLDVREIERGPRASGVYARFSRDGRSLALLDQDGATVRTLGGAAGLIATTRHGQDAPVWVVTGTDEAGVDAAAHALDRASLAYRFALALAPSGPLALPVVR